MKCLSQCIPCTIILRSCFTKKPSPFCLFSPDLSKLALIHAWEVEQEKRRLKNQHSFHQNKTGARLRCQYCSSRPAGTKYECPYCPLPLLLPQLLRPLCPSCSCNTSPPLHPIVPPCPPPSCPSPGVVLCEAWTWARRRAVSGGNQYLSRALPTKEPKIYGYSRLQWAIYEGAAILTSLQLKELGRQWQNGRRSNKDLWFSLHIPTLHTNDKSKKTSKK